MILNQSKFVLTTIETLLTVGDDYAEEGNSHKVLFELYPVDEWLNKINDVFALHLSATMVLHNFNDHTVEFTISKKLFNQIIMSCPRPPEFELESDQVANVLLAISPIIKRSIEESSSDRFQLSVLDMPIDNNQNLVIHYSVANKI